MTDLRKAAEAVLEVWGWDISEPRRKMFRERIEALRQALTQSKEQGVIVYKTGYDSGYMDASVASKREWVGLTEDEFESILEQHNEAFGYEVYESIEAKLKEKNGG